jgi:hypothetical protein
MTGRAGGILAMITELATDVDVLERIGTALADPTRRAS